MSAEKSKTQWGSVAVLFALIALGLSPSFRSVREAAVSAPAVDVGAAIDAASCRIKVDQTKCYGDWCRIESSLGTGTLIAPNRILTCSHVFNDGGTLSVQFQGKWYPARLLKRTANPDLALLEVVGVKVAPTTYVATFNPSGKFYLAGYGSNDYRRVPAKYVKTQGGHHLFVPQNRSGDSGGGVFNSAGQLVAVQWGGVDGETYTTAGEDLVRFLQ